MCVYFPFYCLVCLMAQTEQFLNRIRIGMLYNTSHYKASTWAIVVYAIRKHADPYSISRISERWQGSRLLRMMVRLCIFSIRLFNNRLDIHYTRNRSTKRMFSSLKLNLSIKKNVFTCLYAITHKSPLMYNILWNSLLMS